MTYLEYRFVHDPTDARQRVVVSLLATRVAEAERRLQALPGAQLRTLVDQRL